MKKKTVIENGNVKSLKKKKTNITKKKTTVKKSDSLKQNVENVIKKDTPIVKKKPLQSNIENSLKKKVLIEEELLLQPIIEEPKNNKKEVQKLKKKKSKIIYLIIFILSLTIIIFLIFKFATWSNDNNAIKKIEKEVIEETVIEDVVDDEKVEVINPPKVDIPNDYWDYIKVPMMNVDFTELLNKNKDTVGWIQINGTNINYPIVQTTDNNYYLNHAFNNKINSAGWIYGDYRNNWNTLNKNTIIYGHGRLDNTLFGTLKNVLSSKWQSNKENFTVRISTPNENTIWQVFSVYTIKKESYYITNEFRNDRDYQTFINTLQSRSIFSFNTDVNTLDNILTLSTCQDNFNNRIVLHAKLISKVTR